LFDNILLNLMSVYYSGKNLTLETRLESASRFWIRPPYKEVLSTVYPPPILFPLLTPLQLSTRQSLLVTSLLKQDQ